MLLTTLKIVQLIPLSAGCLALNFHICFELLGSALLPPPRTLDRFIGNVTHLEANLFADKLSLNISSHFLRALPRLCSRLSLPLACIKTD